MNYEELEKAEQEAEKLLNPAEKAQEEKVETLEKTDVEKKVEPKIEEKNDTQNGDVIPDKKEKTDVDVNAELLKAEQRYKTLKGMFDAEVPRTQAENKKLKEQTAELEKKIAELENSISSAKMVQQGAEIDAEIEALELDYPTLANALKKFKATTVEQINALKDGTKVKPDESVKADIESVKTDVNEVKLVRFDLEMNKLGVPDWQDIDNSDEFKEWLQEKVPYTDKTKLQLLKDAAIKLDSATVSQFFLDYKKSKEAFPQKDGQEKLKQFVAPPRGGQSAPLTGGQSDLTLAKYTKFMKDTTGSDYRFNPQEWGGKTEAQVEQMFNDAITKGALR
ncbi:MAG: hypothetical protein WC332_00475 [Clostridia bacterium]|jgi:hypothetical protein